MRVGGLLVDLDGTLYVGDEPVEGAREAIGKLESSGLVLRYVTNTTRKPRREVSEHLRSLGFDAGHTASVKQLAAAKVPRIDPRIARLL